jgi:hypothetical protein
LLFDGTGADSAQRDLLHRIRVVTQVVAEPGCLDANGLGTAGGFVGR